MWLWDLLADERNSSVCFTRDTRERLFAMPVLSASTPTRVCSGYSLYTYRLSLTKRLDYSQCLRAPGSSNLPSSTPTTAFTTHPNTSAAPTLPPGYTTTVIYPTPSYILSVSDGKTITIGVADPPTDPITLTIPIPTKTVVP